MKEPLTTIPYDNDDRMAYPHVPEFIADSVANRIYVRQGTYAITPTFRVLASEGFAACSGVIIKNASSRIFGLLHILPTQALYEADFKKLKLLAGGQLILIEGSKSTPKTWVLRDLSRKLGIEHIDTLTLDTKRPEVGNMHFHIALKPIDNELLVSRNSHKDLLTYTAFT
jgi:hypothetical protein